MSAYAAWSREKRSMKRSLLGPEPETMRRWLAFLRISVGAFYLYAFASKLLAGFPASLPQSVAQYAEHARFDFGRAILTYAIAHHHVFAWIVLVAEFIAGSMLLIGLATRIVAFAALVLQLAYLVVTFGDSLTVTLANGLFMAALLVIAGTDGGWRWSVDELIENRK